MATSAYLAEIWVYPIKSLDGQRRPHSDLVPRWGLALDRHWAMLDPDGVPINGKRTASVHHVAASFEWDPLRVTLRRRGGDGGVGVFCLPEEVVECQQWLERAFQQSLQLASRHPGGWPDDEEASGPTLVSRATLEEIASWFPPATADQMRARFRPNLVIDGVPPFWEDSLLPAPGRSSCFRIGPHLFEAVNPCRRCVVPTRDPETGESDRDFMRRFLKLRETTLPVWAPRHHFDHFYRLTLNTRWLGDTSGRLEEGMPVIPASEEDGPVESA